MTDSDTTRAINDPGAPSRAYQDMASWQRADLGTGGRYTGRDYYDRTVAKPAISLPRSAAPGAVGRAVKVVGLVVALAGIAGWLWLILALLSAVGAGNLPDNAFSARLAGIPLGSGGLVAILIGGALALIGTLAERSARRRVRWEPGTG